MLAMKRLALARYDGQKKRKKTNRWQVCFACTMTTKQFRIHFWPLRCSFCLSRDRIIYVRKGHPTVSFVKLFGWRPESESKENARLKKFRLITKTMKATLDEQEPSKRFERAKQWNARCRNNEIRREKKVETLTRESSKGLAASDDGWHRVIKRRTNQEERFVIHAKRLPWTCECKAKIKI